MAGLGGQACALLVRKAASEKPFTGVAGGWRVENSLRLPTFVWLRRSPKGLIGFARTLTRDDLGYLLGRDDG